MSKRADPPVKKNAFVHKLYSMLNDSTLSELIWWTGGDDSNTFALFPGKEFASALTRYFKHGNVASFVRQLHMYGFHKVSEPHAHRQDDDDSQPPMWEFKHSSGRFRKNDESSLLYIKRRSSSNTSRNSIPDHESNYLVPTSTPSPTYEGYHPFPHAVPSSRPAYIHPQPPPPPHLLQHHSQIQQPQMYPYYVLPAMPPGANPGQAAALQAMQHAASHPGNHIMQMPGMFAPVSVPASASTSSAPENSPAPSAEPAHDDEKPHHLYAPNLQFRHIWEKNDDEPRPRTPSLLYDPLATSGAQKFHEHGPHMVPVAAVPRSVTPSELLHPHVSRSLPGSLSGPMPRPKSHPNSQSTPGRIRLPPPASLASYSSSRTSSPGPGDPSSHRMSSLTYESPNKVPISLLHRLRPSLLELHTDSHVSLQKNSIDSQSSYNSIFSASSSISSDSSFPRNTLFGSISFAGVDSTKASILIGPHDIPEEAPANGARELPVNVQHFIQPVLQPEHKDETSERELPTLPALGSLPRELPTRPHLGQSDTQPTAALKVQKRPSIQSPHPRSSLSMHAPHLHAYQKVRSHTLSPLSRYSYGQIDVKDRLRVSVTSLLTDKPPPTSRLTDLNSTINESEENSSASSVSSEEVKKQPADT